jgi:ABC-type multidrug transport system ATPase subunit
VPIPLAPNDRYACIGKTGSGKTSFATVLATTLIPVDEGEWQAWWIDTKGDPKDIKRLK